jgi:hypothetical protein
MIMVDSGLGFKKRQLKMRQGTVRINYTDFIYEILDDEKGPSILNLIHIKDTDDRKRVSKETYEQHMNELSKRQQDLGALVVDRDAAISELQQVTSTTDTKEACEKLVTTNALIKLQQGRIADLISRSHLNINFLETHVTTKLSFTDGQWMNCSLFDFRIMFKRVTDCVVTKKETRYSATATVDLPDTFVTELTHPCGTVYNNGGYIVYNSKRVFVCDSKKTPIYRLDGLFTNIRDVKLQQDGTLYIVDCMRKGQVVIVPPGSHRDSSQWKTLGSNLLYPTSVSIAGPSIIISNKDRHVLDEYNLVDGWKASFSTTTWKETSRVVFDDYNRYREEEDSDSMTNVDDDDSDDEEDEDEETI